jgi:hypothetical protein
MSGGSVIVILLIRHHAWLPPLAPRRNTSHLRAASRLPSSTEFHTNSALRNLLNQMHLAWYSVLAFRGGVLPRAGRTLIWTARGIPKLSEASLFFLDNVNRAGWPLVISRTA